MVTTGNTSLEFETPRCPSAPSGATERPVGVSAFHPCQQVEERAGFCPQLCQGNAG